MVSSRKILIGACLSLGALCACKPAAPGTASAGLGAGLIPASSGMVVFTDPTEDAFTVSAPQGWTTKGGIERRTPTSASAWLSAVSADGTESIFSGDPSVPMFTLPSAQHPAGDTVQTVNGPEPVAAYENGAQFAADYAQRAFSATCSNLQPTKGQPEPALVQKAQSDAARMTAEMGAPAPTSTTYDGASQQFSCQVGGAPYVVTVFAVTADTPATIGGFWNVPIIFGYRAPAAQQTTVDGYARTLQASYQRNPQWDAKMVAAARQRLAAIQAQGAQQMQALTRQEGQENGALNQQAQSIAANSQAEHQAFMTQFNQQGADRNAAFAQHMYQKNSGQQAEMRYISNQRCIAWNDAAHTSCRVTAPN